MKSSASKRIIKRSPDKTTLTISLPKSLKSEIEARAAQSDRTVSNYMVTEIAKKLGMPL